MSSPYYDDVLKRVKECYGQNSYPWVETSQVAEVFDCSDRTVRDRLDKLRERGELKGRKVSSGWLWYFEENPYSDSAVSPASDTQ